MARGHRAGGGQAGSYAHSVQNLRVRRCRQGGGASRAGHLLAFRKLFPRCRCSKPGDNCEGRVPLCCRSSSFCCEALRDLG